MSDAASAISTNDSMQYANIWKMVVYYKISEILTIIHCRYPAALTNADLKVVFANLKKRIQLADIAYKHKKKPRKKREHKKIDIGSRCLARCWLKSDINGKQCSRKKIGDSNVCKSHSINSPHGLITDPITPHMKANFEKYGQKNELK